MVIFRNFEKSAYVPSKKYLHPPPPPPPPPGIGVILLRIELQFLVFCQYIFIYNFVCLLCSQTVNIFNLKLQDLLRILLERLRTI